MTAAAVILGGLLLASYGLLAFLVRRRPLLGRIAVSQALRQPYQSLVVVASLMIGAAAIYGVQVMTDSIQEGSAGAVMRASGRVDLEVTGSGRTFDPAVAAQLAGDRRLAPLAAGVQADLELDGAVVDVDRGTSRPAVHVLGFDPASQPAFGAFTLTDGRQSLGGDLRLGQVLLSQPLAELLGARPGDRLRVRVGGSAGAGDEGLTVGGIATRQGAGAFGSSRSVYAPLPTAQRLAGTQQINVVMISARGDGDAELQRAHALAAQVRRALTFPSAAGLRVIESKEAARDFELRAPARSRLLLTSLSLLIALAAATLVVNVALALAEERRPQLGVLRALGLGRGELVQLAVMEAALYGLAAALAGALLGILAGWGLAMFWRGFADPLLDDPSVLMGMPLSIRADTLIASGAAAALITLGAMLAAAVRASRMTISSAIKALPEPEFRSAWRWRLRAMGLVLFAATGVALLVVGGPALRLLGGACVICLSILLTRWRLPDRLRLTLGCGAAVTWAITSLAGGVGAAPAERIVLLLLALPIAAFGLSILVAVNLDVLDVVSSFAGLVSGSLKATLRPPLAYLGRHRVRSSLVTSALAIVVALVTAFAAYVATYKPDYARDSAGWQARVWSPDAPLSSSVSLPATSRQETIASRYYHGPVRIESPDLPAASGFHQQSLLLFGLDDRQLDGRILPLVSREARYRDDRAVWQALGRDPTLAVSGTDAPGSTIWLQGGQGMVGLHVIASTTYGSPLLPGVIASTRGLAPFEASPAGMVMLLDWPAGQDTAAMTRQMRALVAGEGADATSVQELLDAQFARNQGFLAFSLALLRAGLLIGVFSVGAVALRAAGERRRLIASLRMLGYRPAQVVAGLATEAVLGVTVGVAVGLVVGYGIGVPAFRQQMLGEFWPDPATLATALTFIYAAVLLVTVAPALHAAHRRPAEAVRIT